MTRVPAAEPRTRIKICGLTREQDVDSAVACGADAVGFVLYAASPRAVTAQRAGALARRLPAFVTPVLLFVNPTPEAVQDALAQVPGACLQFHGDETPEQCERLSGGHPWLKAARIPLDPARPFDLLDFASTFAAARSILLDADSPGYGGSGHSFPWSRIPPHVGAHLVLSGGLTSENVADGIASVRPRALSLAVDVSTGVEATDEHGAPRKGIKDAHRIQAFIAAVRRADGHTAPCP